jgi:hypothetical protein
MSLPVFDCTFCGAAGTRAKVLISAQDHNVRGRQVYICDECVGICLEIVAERSPQTLPGLAMAPLRMVATDLQYACRRVGHVAQVLGEVEELNRLAKTLVDITEVAGPPELDRAVQSEIARAFGALIQAMMDGEDCFSMWWTDEIASHHRDQIHQDAIRKVSTILHTAMGGRIPDEVSR